MTATLSNFVSALTQGNEDTNTVMTAGSVGNDTVSNYGISAPVADWTRVWRLTDVGTWTTSGNPPQSNSAAAISFLCWAHNHTQPTANHIIAGFYIYLEDTTPTADRSLIVAQVASNADLNTLAGDAFRLALQTDGDLALYDSDDTTTPSATATTPFTDNTWHRVEIRWLPSATVGEVQVWVDGTDVFGGNQTGLNTEDYGQSQALWISGASAETGDVYTFVAGGYFMINSTAASDRLDSAFEVIGPYQNTAITGGTPDAGNALDGAGTNWATTQEIPFSDETSETDAAEYDGTPLSGTIHYDGGSRAGPSGDSRIDGTSNIKGWKGIWRLERGNGGGTTHTAYLGDDGATFSSGFDSFTPSLNTTAENWYFCTGTATNMPTSTDNFSQGVGVSGNRDLYIHEMAAFVLHTPAAGPVPAPPPLIMAPPQPGMRIA